MEEMASEAQRAAEIAHQEAEAAQKQNVELDLACNQQKVYNQGQTLEQLSGAYLGKLQMHAHKLNMVAEDIWREAEEAVARHHERHESAEDMGDAVHPALLALPRGDSISDIG